MFENINIFKRKANPAGLINDIRTMTDKIASSTYTGIPQYIEGDRSTLNVLIMQVLMGCTIRPTAVKDLNAAYNGGKVDRKAVQFNLKLPTHTQVAEVAGILREFIPKENLILARMNAVIQGIDPETVVVPPASIILDVNGQPQQRVRMLDAPSNKKIREEIFHQDMMVTCRLDDADCYTLAAMGEQARKKSNRDRMLIVGGVTIVMAAAGTGGIMYYRHYKKAKLEAEKSTQEFNGSVGTDDLADAGAVTEDGILEVPNGALGIPTEPVNPSTDADADMPQVILH